MVGFKTVTYTKVSPQMMKPRDVAVNTEDLAVNTEDVAVNTEDVAVNTEDVAVNTEDVAVNTEEEGPCYLTQSLHQHCTKRP